MASERRRPLDPILEEIAAGRVADVYLIHGPDGFRHEEVLAALQAVLVPAGLEAMFLHIVDGAQVAPEDLAAMAGAVAFGGGKRLLVLRDVPAEGASGGRGRGKRAKAGSAGEAGGSAGGGVGASAAESSALLQVLLRYLSEPSPSTCLVLTCQKKLEAGHPLVRAVTAKGRLVPADVPGRKELIPWTRHYLKKKWGKSLAPDAAALLVDRCRQERLLLRGELDKLANYVGERREIEAADILAVVGKTSEESVFELLDAIGKREAGEALRLARECASRGEEPLAVLGLLARQVRLTWQAKAMLAQGVVPGEIGRRLAVHPYVAEKTVQQAKKSDEAHLMQALQAVLEADVLIKTGTCPPRTALETLCVRLCQ